MTSRRVCRSLQRHTIRWKNRGTSKRTNPQRRQEPLEQKLTWLVGSAYGFFPSHVAKSGTPGSPDQISDPQRQIDEICAGVVERLAKLPKPSLELEREARLRGVVKLGISSGLLVFEGQWTL